MRDAGKYTRLPFWIGIAGSVSLHLAPVVLTYFQPTSRSIGSVVSVALPGARKDAMQVVDRTAAQLIPDSTIEAELPPEKLPEQPEASLPAYTADQLDRQPTPVGELSLDPPTGFPPEVAGRAEISLLIAPDGAVLSVTFDKATLDQATLQQISDHLMRSRFSPGVVNGKPVQSVIRIEVNVANSPAAAPTHEKMAK